MHSTPGFSEASTPISRHARAVRRNDPGLRAIRTTLNPSAANCLANSEPVLVHDPRRLGEFGAGGWPIRVRAECTADRVVLDQRRVDIGGMPTINLDIMRRKPFSEDLHQPDHPVLGGGVVGHTNQTAQSGDGIRHDHGARATRNQVLRAGAARMPYARENDIQHGAPGILANIERRSARSDSGGVLSGTTTVSIGPPGRLAILQSGHRDAAPACGRQDLPLTV